MTKKEMEEEEEQPTSPHPGPEAFSLKMLVDSRNAGAVLGTRARRLVSCHLASQTFISMLPFFFPFVLKEKFEKRFADRNFIISLF